MCNKVVFCVTLLTLFVLSQCLPKSSTEEDTDVIELNWNDLTPDGKQLFVGGGGAETSTPNFVRLVVMRLIYGIASTMGLEERLESVFNGIFVPPNADNDLFGFGGFDGGDDGGDLLDLGDILDV